MIRAAGIVGALAICAWFGLGVRQATDTEDARRIVSLLERPSARQSARAATLLSRAGTLNPDRSVDLLRAQLALQRGDRPQARRIIAGVLRDEPDNIDAWTRLAFTVGRADRPTFAQAVRQIHRLAPPVPAP
jgi:Flp pilus assembly protein TadD